MSMVKVTIDGQIVEVPSGSTILDASKKAGINIPTLCYHPDQAVKANCRVCVVEVEGQRVLQAACAFPVWDGMVINTNTPVVREARRNILELILSHHPQDCLACSRNGKCELQKLAADYNIRELHFPLRVKEYGKDTSSPSLVRDQAKCINCRRCIGACSGYQTVDALWVSHRGFDAMVTPTFEKPIAETTCVNCGQCILVCPTGAIAEKDDTDRVWDALGNEKKYVVVQTAPAIRIGLGEEFGMPAGSISTGKMVAALRRLGFDAVFDTDFTADLTIIEEGNELLQRIKTGGTLPMITSCSPGWIKFIEHFYPEYLGNLSTCKSPQQMFGALLKTYYADKINKDAADIVAVSIMPCTAKKFECQRPEMRSSGYQDVDVVLTTRELAKMIRQAGIDFNSLPDEEFDLPFGLGSGAGEIFGATGGVMEAALRTVYEVVTGKPLENIEFEAVRGMEGVKEASVDLNGTEVKVAVAHGLANARKVMDAVKAGTADYHFIEIMACPGGCIGGGGQPIGTTNAIREKRIMAVYQEDRNLPVRKSHENPAVNQLYKEFLVEPLGEKSHHLLHTHYTPRGKYPMVGEYLKVDGVRQKKTEENEKTAG